jgi:hypothetical protein
MSRWFWLLLGCLVALFGTGLVLPVLAKYKQSGTLPLNAAVCLAVGAMVVMAGLCLIACGIKRLLTRARMPH